MGSCTNTDGMTESFEEFFSCDSIGGAGVKWLCKKEAAERWQREY